LLVGDFDKFGPIRESADQSDLIGNNMSLAPLSISQYVAEAVRSPRWLETYMDDLTLRVMKVAAPLRQQVVDGIRRGITVGRFPAGSRLIERDLCDAVGVSRTLIREALRQLESEGLVKVIPNKGPIVAEISAHEAAMLYQVLAELVGLACTLFVEHASPTQILRLKNARRELKRSYSSRDVNAVLATKTVFHEVLIEGAGNEILGVILGQLDARAMMLGASTLLQPGRMKSSQAEIERIFEAIMRGDGEDARKAAIAHVSRAAEVAVKLLNEKSSSVPGRRRSLPVKESRRAAR
jgi:DNA-binding GntR family transcriptional regulator